jgi:CBS domain-containing protein
MKNSNSGCALVVADGKLVGIFTEHDVMQKLTGDLSVPPALAGGLPGDLSEPPALAGGLPASSATPIKDLMSPNPETLHERDSVAEALNKMSLGRYRHIPFVRPDGTYAVASIQSVLKYIAREDW